MDLGVGTDRDVLRRDRARLPPFIARDRPVPAVLRSPLWDRPAHRPGSGPALQALTGDAHPAVQTRLVRCGPRPGQAAADQRLDVSRVDVPAGPARRLGPG